MLLATVGCGIVLRWSCSLQGGVRACSAHACPTGEYSPAGASAEHSNWGREAREYSPAKPLCEAFLGSSFTRFTKFLHRARAMGASRGQKQGRDTTERARRNCTFSAQQLHAARRSHLGQAGDKMCECICILLCKLAQLHGLQRMQ